MRKRDYRDYINDIFDSIGDLENFIKDMDFKEFAKDRDCCEMPFSVILSEAKDLISDEILRPSASE